MAQAVPSRAGERPRRGRRTAVLLVVVAVGGATAVAAARLGQGSEEIEVALPAGAAECESLDAAHCLLPFPSDALTEPDETTDTGRRVALPAQAAATVTHPETVTEVNRNDGFSPGAALVTVLPGVDLAASGAASSRDVARSLDPDAPIVIVEAESGQRHPYWAELDGAAPADETPLTLIRPAESFRPGHRYVVAIRDVVDGGGEPIEPSDVFRAYRDGLRTRVAELEERRDHMEDVFARLDDAGVDRDELVLAWDFTVASSRDLSERVLAMRDDAFSALGSEAPSFTVTSVEESHKDTILHEVLGTFEVPSYLTGDGSTGSVLDNGDGPGSSPIPERNGTLIARFACVLPASASGDVEPTRLALYGPSLLGSRDDVRGLGSAIFYPFTNTTFCATDWTGLSTDDEPFLQDVLAGQASVRSVADRLQQSLVSNLFLARLMAHPDGLSTDPAFQADDGTPLLDHAHLGFVDLNQAGLGAALSAIAQDWEHSFLAPSGMNLSLYRDRSRNFEDLNAAAGRDAAWLDRQLGVLVDQLLWDRAEPTGHAHHLTRDTYPDTPAKRVLLFQAFGDHQVPNLATETMARTIRAQLRTPALPDDRSADGDPFWGLAAGPDDPSDGSLLVVWDSGTPPPPADNSPSWEGEDSHSEPLNQPAALEMVAAFLDQGSFVDTCDGAPCEAPILQADEPPDGP